MKKLLLTLALGATLSVGALAPAAFAQGPPPAPPSGAPAAGGDHAQLQAALQKLGLSPKQKIQAAKILKNAKETNQDKLTTMKQLETVLTPQQLQQLKQMMAAKAGPGGPKAPK